MRLLPGLALVSILAFSSTVSAQTYVGASFIVDVVRVSGPTEGGGPGSGEAYGGALRVGTALGPQWGVELEFARTAEIDASPDVRILGGVERVVSGSGSSSPLFPSGTLIFPAPRISSERQLSTLSTLLWWSHDIGDRASLAYLGGVAFTRSEFDLRIEYDDFPFPPFPIPAGGVPLPLLRPNIESESVAYDADVTVGLEARIRMTDHVRLTPGVRMQTAAGGWAIRPGVGLQWVF